MWVRREALLAPPKENSKFCGFMDQLFHSYIGNRFQFKDVHILKGNYGWIRELILLNVVSESDLRMQILPSPKEWQQSL